MLIFNVYFDRNDWLASKCVFANSIKYKYKLSNINFD